MAERVQSKGEKHLPSLFHFALIKLLVLHELERRKMSWDGFMSTSGLRTHAKISLMEAHEEESKAKEIEAFKAKETMEEVEVPKVAEIVKETRRDTIAASKGKRKI